MYTAKENHKEPKNRVQKVMHREFLYWRAYNDWWILLFLRTCMKRHGGLLDWQHVHSGTNLAYVMQQSNIFVYVRHAEVILKHEAADSLICSVWNIYRKSQNLKNPGTLHYHNSSLLHLPFVALHLIFYDFRNKLIDDVNSSIFLHFVDKSDSKMRRKKALSGCCFIIFKIA